MVRFQGSKGDIPSGLPNFCGRRVGAEEWETVAEIVGGFSLSRAELAATICEVLEWTRPTGKLKKSECLTWLSELEEGGYLTLPGKEARGRKKGQATRVEVTAAGEARRERVGGLNDAVPVRIALVETDSDRKLWRELVERYHYLGHKVPFGAHLRYLILGTWQGDIEVMGCLQYSSPALKVADRDRWIGWDEAARKANLQKVVQQSRFLIVPWVRIKGLASHVLSVSSRGLAGDWEKTYQVRPVLLETFVNAERFKGTCYAAANWVQVGTTAGRGRMDRYEERKEAVKTCWVYPLVRQAREALRHV